MYTYDGSTRDRLALLTSAATPITSKALSVPRKSMSNCRRWPSGSALGQSIRAPAALTTATGAPMVASCRVNARPRRIGIPIVAKYPSETVLASVREVIRRPRSTITGGVHVPMSG